MASSEQYARVDPYTQTQRTDQIQQHGPQWRPAQPTLAQNQWFEPSGHYLNVPSQRRSVGTYGGSQMHTDRWINEPISRRQDTPPDHDGYKGAVQNQNTGMNSFHETAEFAPNRASQAHTAREYNPRDCSLLAPEEESCLRREVPGRQLREVQTEARYKPRDAQRPRAPQAQATRHPETPNKGYYTSLRCENHEEEDGSKRQPSAGRISRPVGRQNAPSRQYEAFLEPGNRFKLSEDQRYDQSHATSSSGWNPSRKSQHGVPEQQEDYGEYYRQASQQEDARPENSSFYPPAGISYVSMSAYGIGEHQSNAYQGFENTRSGFDRRYNQSGRPVQESFQGVPVASSPEVSIDVDGSGFEGPSITPTERVIGADLKRAKKAKKTSTRLQQIGDSNVLQVLDPVDSEWKPAVYHWQLRELYISQHDPREKFDVPRAKGQDALDITTFLQLWKHWRSSRNDGWVGTQADVLYRFDRKGYPVPSYTPGYLIHEGLIVLDLDDNPVKDWQELPLCLSSQLEGFDIETVRRINPNITLQDFRARMPKETLMGPRKDIIRPLAGLTALGNRTTRFRERNACPSWIDRTASDHLRHRVWDMMSEEQRRENTTKGLPMLSELDVAELKKKTRGKFLERAGGRALSTEEREKRHAAEEERLEKLRKNAEHQQQPNQQQKRKYGSMDSSEDRDVQYIDTQRPGVPRMPHSRSWLEASKDTRQFKRSRITEDCMDENASPQVVRHRPAQRGFYSRHSPFSDSIFERSGHQPPISHPVEQGYQLQTRVDAPGRTENSHRSCQLTPTGYTECGSSRNLNENFAGLPANQSYISTQSSRQHIRKRHYGETYSTEEELFESRPKRREFVLYSSVYKDPVTEHVLNTPTHSLLRSWRAGCAQVRTRSALNRHRITSSRVQGLTQDLVNSTPDDSTADRRQDEVIDLTTEDELPVIKPEPAQSPSPSRYNDSVEDQLSFQREESIFDNKRLTLDISHDNVLFQGENDNTLPPHDSDNALNPLFEGANGNDDLPAPDEFHIHENANQDYQEAPNLNQNINFAAVVDFSTISDKENRTSLPEPTNRQGNSAPAPAIIQTMPESQGLPQTHAMVPMSQEELDFMSQFFDFDAASAGPADIQKESPQYAIPFSDDYRFVDPITEQDRQHIQDALWYTLAEVKLLRGPVDIYTSVEKNYYHQWLQLKAGFTDVCKLNNVPQLTYMEGWYRSFANWPTPNITIEKFDQFYAVCPDGAPSFRHPDGTRSDYLELFK